MRIGIPVRHSIHDQHDMVTVIVGAARGRFDAGTGCDTGQEDLGYATLE